MFMLLREVIKYMMQRSGNTYKSISENVFHSKSMGTLIHIISSNNCKMDNFINIAESMGYRVAIINKDTKVPYVEGEQIIFLRNEAEEGRSEEKAEVDRVDEVLS